MQVVIYNVVNRKNLVCYMICL